MADRKHLELVRKGVQVWNAWRLENPTIEPDLDGADLSGVDLAGAAFANMSLNGTYLALAELSEADFTRTFCRNMSFARANLTGAKFRASYLDNVAFIGANLTETDFGSAWLQDCVFANLDLSSTKGLESALVSTSSVGLETLYKSSGNVPDELLSSVGVPKAAVAAVKAIVAAGTSVYCSCLIRHDRADRSFARRLHDRLRRQGVHCWLDENDAACEDDAEGQVERELRAWDKVLFCCSEQALTKAWLEQELAAALEKERQLAKERDGGAGTVMAIQLDGHLSRPECETKFRAEIERRTAADFTGWEQDVWKFDIPLERLFQALQA